ncbi:DUF3800 domain-containing protein [Fervidobacterium thailandense]|uniref:DUF3800 domain-containing protein n=1 Tax=Fervidobacterium thailandense TaxID=1008305 RepID=A0A1E3G0S1_9BACT|nr:DUF3800 domain-containing protein [Fervidobacterium thailandense]ODN29825.1 hypothetical protein A4H02_08715 [Fervidobacterium thailandense]
MKAIENFIEIFMDESESEDKRFTSICSISGNPTTLLAKENELRKQLNRFQISELKFSELHRRNVPKELIYTFLDIAILSSINGEIRIDVLTFDKHDSRHNVRGRDDEENLKRMIYHLLRNVCYNWKAKSFAFYPDQHTNFSRFLEPSKYIELTKLNPLSKKIKDKSLFRDESWFPKVEKVEMKDSKAVAIIQLCDIFAGIHRFSLSRMEKLKYIKNCRLGQMPMFQPQEIKEESSSEKLRFDIIFYIKEQAEKHKLPISLESKGYLCTHDPKCNLNFWFYSPQSEKDKAPTRR